MAFDLELPESLGTGRIGGPFAAANPRAEAPVLVDGPTRIFESTVIMGYIEERWSDAMPCPPLCSPGLDDPLRSKRIRAWGEPGQTSSSVRCCAMASTGDSLAS